MRSVELFAGAGGLAFGVHQAGFQPEVIVEYDADTCTTIRANKQRNIAPMVQAELWSGDVRDFDYSHIRSGIDLVSGGPPCQPFSIGGKHRAFADERDMFPEAVRAVRQLQPKAFLFENVKGLTREKFTNYFHYIKLQLQYPEIAPRSNDEWMEHLARLEQHHTAGTQEGLTYRVVSRLVNAADYGVPQRRERVFIVGFRSDIQQAWTFPEETHSQDALLWSQFVTQDYWEWHNVTRAQRPQSTGSLAKRAAKLRMGEATDKLPWRTIREAFATLPDPRDEVEAKKILNHEFRPGARAYTGHTGSPYDEPAKALKAGDHGVPGGENMVVLPNGDVRYFTVRESARLQAFPDDYYFPVSWTESMRQLGNAVPVTLGRIVAKSIARVLGQHQK